MVGNYELFSHGRTRLYSARVSLSTTDCDEGLYILQNFNWLIVFLKPTHHKNLDAATDLHRKTAHRLIYYLLIYIFLPVKLPKYVGYR